MKKLFLSIIVFIAVSFTAFSQLVFVNANTTIYHKAGCASIKSEPTSMQISNARSLNFDPCLSCKPEGNEYDYTKKKKIKNNTSSKKETPKQEIKKKETAASSKTHTNSSKKSSNSSKSKKK